MSSVLPRKKADDKTEVLPVFWRGRRGQGGQGLAVRPVVGVGGSEAQRTGLGWAGHQLVASRRPSLCQQFGSGAVPRPRRIRPPGEHVCGRRWVGRRPGLAGSSEENWLLREHGAGPSRQGLCGQGYVARGAWHPRFQGPQGLLDSRHNPRSLRPARQVVRLWAALLDRAGLTCQTIHRERRGLGGRVGRSVAARWGCPQNWPASLFWEPRFAQRLQGTVPPAPPGSHWPWACGCHSPVSASVITQLLPS